MIAIGSETITTFSRKRMGRPLTLGTVTAGVQSYLKVLWAVGTPINLHSTYCYCFPERSKGRTILVEHGGSLYTRSWAISCEWIGLCKMASNNSVKRQDTGLEFSEAEVNIPPAICQNIGTSSRFSNTPWCDACYTVGSGWRRIPEGGYSLKRQAPSDLLWLSLLHENICPSRFLMKGEQLGATRLLPFPMVFVLFTHQTTGIKVKLWYITNPFCSEDLTREKLPFEHPALVIIINIFHGKCVGVHGCSWS